MAPTSKRRGAPPDPTGLQATLALALTAAAIAAGVALGHHTAAAPVPASADPVVGTTPQPGDGAADPSRPATTDAAGPAAQEPASPTSRF